MEKMNVWISDSQLESMKRFQEWWLDSDRGFHKNVPKYDFSQKPVKVKSIKRLNGRSLTKKYQDSFLSKSGRNHR